jgi:hypothetical protein
MGSGHEEIVRTWHYPVPTSKQEDSMCQRSYILLTLAALLAGPIQAAQDVQAPAVVFSQSSLVRKTFSVGKSQVEIFAGRNVDAEALLAGIDPTKDFSAQSISDQVDQARKLLFPDEEIVLSVTPPQEPHRVLPAQASLARAIFWWNNTNCDGCYWYAEYLSTAATMFIADIQYGAYNLYDKIGNGKWVHKFYAPADSTWTLFSVGSRTKRGFQGVALEGGSRAHIVMYFFK